MSTVTVTIRLNAIPITDKFFFDSHFGRIQIYSLIFSFVLTGSIPAFFRLILLLPKYTLQRWGVVFNLVFIIKLMEMSVGLGFIVEERFLANRQRSLINTKGHSSHLNSFS